MRATPGDFAPSGQDPSLLAGTPVRRALAIEALVIVRRGRFTPADVGIFLALRRQYRLVARIRRADAGRLLRCFLRRHAAIIPGAADGPTGGAWVVHRGQWGRRS